jgi:phospholipid/cholesterol/gamma-HCH transport system substrate-binding protein
VIARIASVGALAAAVVLVVLVLFSNSSSYTLRAEFQDVGGLVTGDDVLIGPARVGSVQTISLGPNGVAEVVVGIDSSASPVPQGTIARIYENSLSGIANKYVVLEPSSRDNPPLKSGSTIGEDHTYSPVNLDQLFDSLDPLTRAGLKGFIQGEAASVQARGTAANRTLKYFAPGLASTSNLTAELTRNEPAFDGLVVQGAQALQALASRSQQLTNLIAHTNTTAAAIASQSQALQQALVLLPGTLTRSTTTFAGLRSTLDRLDPLVTASKPAVRRLTSFASAFRVVVDESVPTIGELAALIHNPSGAGDLTTLALEAPSLVKLTTVAIPRLIKQLNDSQHQLDYLREYAPDVVAALTNLGQASAYYDGNGHYTRTQPVFDAFSINGSNQLSQRPPSARYQGLQTVKGRCPGGAIQPSPDGSAPWTVPGCTPASTPPGP